MEYALLQTNYLVATLTIDTALGTITKINEIVDPSRLPLSVKYPYFKNNPVKAFQAWLSDRQMPRSRDHLDELLPNRTFSIIPKLSLQSFALNLSDHYWLKPKNTSILWQEINFYRNAFTDTALDAQPTIQTKSPDYTTNGNISKFWRIMDGQRVLYKAGREPYYQEPFNEVIASDLLNKAHIPHIPYSLQTINGKPWSVCETGVDENTEFVPAADILEVIPKNKNDSEYTHLLKCIEALQIPVLKKEIDTMVQFDYLINNEDRHYGNFGFLRNVNTLQFLGLFPLFDHGNSLWYDTPLSLISQYKQPSMPFAVKQDKQLKYTDKSVSWLRLLNDDCISDRIRRVLQGNSRMSNDRIEKIIEMTLHRKHSLECYAESR